MVFDKVDYGSNWSRSVRVICPWITKYHNFHLVYTLVSTHRNKSALNLVKIHMTMRTWMSLIMSLIGPNNMSFFVHQLVLTWFTIAATFVYAANLKILMVEPKRPRAKILCTNYHFVDLYKFCIQEAPRIMTGPASGLIGMYIHVDISQAIIRKIYG